MTKKFVDVGRIFVFQNVAKHVCQVPEHGVWAFGRIITFKDPGLVFRVVFSIKCKNRFFFSGRKIKATVSIQTRRFDDIDLAVIIVALLILLMMTAESMLSKRPVLGITASLYFILQLSIAVSCCFITSAFSFLYFKV